MIACDRSMISSSSHILLKIHEGLETAQTLERPQLLLLREDESRKKAEVMRRICLRKLFLRMSWTTKLNFLTDLAKCFESTSSLSLLLNTLYTAWGKMACYQEAMRDSEVVFDMTLNDHERVLEKDVLQNVLEQERSWFISLEEPEQIALYLSIVRIAGGSIVRKLFININDIYNKKWEETLKRGKTDDLRVSRDMEFTRGEQTKLLKKLEKVHNEKHDPNNPDTKEVEARRKLWDEALKKYRKQIAILDKKAKKEGKKGAEKKSSKSKSSQKTKDTRRSTDTKKSKDTKSTKKTKDTKMTRGTKKSKGTKVTKSTKKSGKASTKTKKSKKSKKGKKGETEIDWIQILPVWIVKKILDYVDTKTLQRARKVNQYWNYIIGDLFNDRKARQLLNNKVQELKEKLGPLALAKPSPYRPREEQSVFFENMSSKLKVMDKKVKRMIRRGAVTPKLAKMEGATSENFLLGAALQTDDTFLVPFKLTTVFPRYQIKTYPPLYQRHPFHYKDVGIIEEADKNEYEKKPEDAQDNLDNPDSITGSARSLIL